MPYEIEDLFMSIGVMKDYKVKLRDLHVSHTLGYVGTGTPKDRDEVNREGVGDGFGVGPFEVVYYESIKRELKIKPIYECRCVGRLVCLLQQTRDLRLRVSESMKRNRRVGVF
jgi:hypothetical protein